MGAVLTQLTEQGEEHPILYLSKKFSEVEKRYCTTEKECASIVFAIKRLHYYLDGNSFLVMTDHNPLVWLNRNAFKEKKKEYLSNNKGDCKKKRKSLIDNLIKLHLESQELSEEDALEEIITFIMAGYETVAMSTAWALFLIGLHPDVQEKLQEEINKVFGEDIDRDATEDDLNQLNYLNCVLMESSRIYPVIPTFGRQAFEDTVICGHTIPKGASCFVMTYFLHRDVNVFPDPEKFDPDRFSAKNSIKIPECAYTLFSVGPRNCIGQKFAWIEMKVLISSIFTVESLDSRDKVLPIMTVDLAPSTDIRIRIRPRNIAIS
ncbi:cytochrome P450 4c3 [Trichonephila clavipes]|nr:cytochrome P450 4c3 [Trichonephila clavipes]